MKKPSLERMAHLSQVISSIAIMISLIYAGYEYNRVNTLTNRDAEDAIFQRVQEMEQLLIENPDMALIVLKAGEVPEQLLPEEQLRYLAYDHIFYDSWESAWNYYKQGILEEAKWDSWNRWFQMEFLKKPLLSWEGNREHYDGEFLLQVDALANTRR